MAVYGVAIVQSVRNDYPYFIFWEEPFEGYRIGQTGSDMWIFDELARRQLLRASYHVAMRASGVSEDRLDLWKSNFAAKHFLDFTDVDWEEFA